jgi:hypothetical protein
VALAVIPSNDVIARMIAITSLKKRKRAGTHPVAAGVVVVRAPVGAQSASSGSAEADMGWREEEAGHTAHHPSSHRFVAVIH